MFNQHIVLPQKLKVVSEEGSKGVYEIEGLYPGYGHTLGNSLRRIILSSLPGVSITSVKIKGAAHEFSTLDGVKEDVLTILLNLKKIRFSMTGVDSAIVTISSKGASQITGKDITVSGGIEVMNPDQHIAEVTSKTTEFHAEIAIARGLGFVSKEDFVREPLEIGHILVDAIFSPIRKVNYEVSNMRVGDRTDYNLLQITLETDGSISAKDALESAIGIMINQFRAILDLKELENEKRYRTSLREEMIGDDEDSDENDFLIDEIDEDEKVELLKTRIDTLDLSQRTEKALSEASIRTLGGIVQKTEQDLLALDGFGPKSLQEIKEVLNTFKLSLKDN
jgi:DNA-directed RNA polymerase subunit alpha